MSDVVGPLDFLAIYEYVAFMTRSYGPPDGYIEELWYICKCPIGAKRARSLLSGCLFRQSNRHTAPQNEGIPHCCLGSGKFRCNKQRHLKVFILLAPVAVKISFEPKVTDLDEFKGSDRPEATEEKRMMDEREIFIFSTNAPKKQTPTEGLQASRYIKMAS